ncbi:Radical SAM protein [Candidatus Magnetomoraceae bacterium gMMP-13]
MKQTVAFKKNSRNVFFHILTKCNLSCKHCYINPEQHGKGLLPVDTIKKWLKELHSKNSNVIFLGGEPTLHPDLSLAIKEANNLGYKSITVDTNGYLFHDILNKINRDEVDYFSFSLDGPEPETNDPIRGKGSYDKCVSGIREAVAKGFSTSLIYTVSRFNLHELKKMPSLLKHLGIERFFIQVIGIRGKSAKTDQLNLQLTKKEWTGIIPEIAQETASIGIHVTYPKVFLESDEVFECAGKVADNYFIFPNARVYKCPICEDFPIHSMNFKNNKLKKTNKINESQLFELDIAEGCVMNKLIQPDNLSYDKDGRPEYKIACCLLKEEIQ